MKVRVCFWCRRQTRLTDDHLRPKAFGGSDRYTNLVRACRACNAARGLITGAYIQVYRAHAQNEKTKKAAAKALAKLKPEIDKWVALETELLGWSPTAELGTSRCPFPLIKPTSNLGKLEPKIVRSKMEARYRAIAFAMWIDDGGRDVDDRANQHQEDE
jgi:hypothetical protein